MSLFTREVKPWPLNTLEILVAVHIRWMLEVEFLVRGFHECAQDYLGRSMRASKCHVHFVRKT